MNGRGTLLVVALALLVPSCSSDEGEPDAEPSTSPTAAASTSASGTDEPTVDLPEPVGLRQVSGRTIEAEPFADFAVAAGDGIWVTGVAPGAVRYDAARSAVTARTELRGAGVEQALEATAGSVWMPTTDSELLRVDDGTGEVLARTRLPGRPLTEGGVGAVGGTAYVLVDLGRPTVLVVTDDGVTDRIRAPRTAVAVRAGYGALWLPTGLDTVERYDLGTREWTTIDSGPSPRFLDVGFGAVWVMNQSDGSVTRIDARTSEAEVIPAYQYPIRGGDLTTGAGAVWLRTDDSVIRLTPRGEVTDVVELPPGSGSVAATDDTLWITNHDHLAVHRVPLPLPR